MSCYLVLEHPQGPYHAGGEHPGLRDEEQHRLHHGFKEKDGHLSAPSLMRILIILFHTALAWDKLLTTPGQSLSSAEITCTKYQKEVTISRGCP